MYNDNKKQMEHYLLRLDSRACILCDKLNEFLSVYKKYYKEVTA